jgi:membrane protein required for colicin V production
MQLTLFDILALVVVGLSALAALARGAVREVLALASWLGAAVAAFLLLPYVAPLVRPVVAGESLANGVAAVAVFLVALIVFKLLSGMAARSIDGTAAGTVDKVLGFVFGAARGAFVVCAAYLVGSFLIKPELQPGWVRDAYFIGPVQDGAHRIEALIPPAYRPRPATGPATAGGEQGYTDEQRRALDKLVTPQP